MIWGTDPEIFRLGPIAIRYYSLCFVIGFFLGLRYIQEPFKKAGFNKDETDSILTYLIIGTIIGARLGHCLFYQPDYYLSNPLEILKVWEGGLASHGGFLGVLIAANLFLNKHKKQNKSFFWLADILSVPVTLTAGLIRVGNFFNSEILGKPTNLPWGIKFARVDLVARHPAQLYEAFGYFIITYILYVLYKKFVETNIFVKGQLFAIVFILTFSHRFVVEFFKIDQVPFEAGMFINMGQVLSIPFIIIGIFLFIFLAKKVK